MRLPCSPSSPCCAPLHKVRSPHKPCEIASSFSNLGKAREKVLHSSEFAGERAVYEESQTCSGNFSGNQKYPGGVSCVPGLSRCVQSVKQVTTDAEKRFTPASVLSSEAGKEAPLKGFLLEERKSLSQASMPPQGKEMAHKCKTSHISISFIPYQTLYCTSVPEVFLNAACAILHWASLDTVTWGGLQALLTELKRKVRWWISYPSPLVLVCKALCFATRAENGSRWKFGVKSFLGGDKVGMLSLSVTLCENSNPIKMHCFSEDKT